MKKNTKPSWTLVIGDKNLSSWSLRPWLVLRASQIPFKEVLIRLDRPDTTQKIQKYSGLGKVPVLVVGDLKIWDSLAISEFVAEHAHESCELWPQQLETRALARSYVAEMHSGFESMRSQLSMDINLKIKVNHLTSGTVGDIQRVLLLWKTALDLHKGRFLFGDQFGVVDAFYAPVVLRFLSYGITIVDKKVNAYMKRVTTYGPLSEWIAAASRERPQISRF